MDASTEAQPANVSGATVASESTKTPDSATEKTKTKTKTLIITFVRHAECQSNIDRYFHTGDDLLTPNGQSQAERLGAEFANTKITRIYSSHLTRAEETAGQIARQNVSHPKVSILFALREQEHGAAVLRAMARRDDIDIYALRSGNYLQRPPERSYGAPGGGESLEDVAGRAHRAVLHLFTRHGVHAPHPEDPDMFIDLEGNPPSAEYELPHLVVVSHNIFLTEMYEDIYCWNTKEHRATDIHFSNTSWARMLLSYDEDDDKLTFTHLKPPPRSRWY